MAESLAAEIWSDDLLDRKAEAELFQAYIESVWDRPPLHADRKSFTISIDAGYGEGKTFFLKRLAQQLSINHPVAYVDAWRDDLSDDPLVALIATLQEALSSDIRTSEPIGKSFREVLRRSGRIARLVSKGVVRGAANLLVTKEVAESIESALGASSDAVTDAVIDSAKDGLSQTFDVFEQENSRADSEYMQKRLLEFQAGQNAIEGLRDALCKVVSSLDSCKSFPPIVIIVDELDRCRPSYAIKLLEQIKHLFDVRGIVFIFGTNLDQLAHSASAIYGSNFEGLSYLSRFFDRRYKLKSLDRVRMVSSFVDSVGLRDIDSGFPTPVNCGNNFYSFEQKIAFYADQYGLSLRELAKFFRDLETAWIICGRREILFPLLIPMLMASIKRVEIVSDESLKLSEKGLQFRVYNSHENFVDIGWAYFTKSLLEMSGQTFAAWQSISRDDENWTVNWISDYKAHARRASNPLMDPSNYRELIETVGRLSTPSVPAPTG